jgi:5'-nucleotidase / UDP-sugar diphosphatase
MKRMMRMKLLIPALIALSASVGASQPAPPAVLTILHINDVYEIDAVEGGRAGGLARVATVIDGLKRAASPLLVTLGGDYLAPSAIGTARVNGEALAGRQMVDVLNVLGLQWATLGNHEFDVSEAAFHARLAESRFKVVSSNVTDVNGQPFANTVPSAIVPMRVGGRTVRLGLIGVTIDSNRKAWVRYQPPIESARAQLTALAGKVDAIVALTHLSLAGDQDLVTAVPEIDVVLGGHEHENWLVRRGPSFTPIVKADANVRSVAIVSLTFGRAGTRPSVAARLRVIDDKIAAKPSVDATVKRWVTAAFDAFKRDGFDPAEVIATLREPLDGRESTVRNRSGKLTDLITVAMAHEAQNVEVSILNGGSIRIDDVVPAGPLRVYDVIRILPFGGKVLKAKIEGALLKSVLDTGATNQGTGGYLQHWGATRDQDGWQIQGARLDPAKTYSVAITDFLLTGGETGLSFLTRANPQVHDVQELRDIRQAVIDEIKRRH